MIPHVFGVIRHFPTLILYSCCPDQHKEDVSRSREWLGAPSLAKKQGMGNHSNDEGDSSPFRRRKDGAPLAYDGSVRPMSACV